MRRQKNSTIKRKATSGKSQFGTAYSATPPLEEDTAGNDQPLSQAALNGYFDNLAAAEMNEKSVLEELVTNLTTLTISNAEMATTIKKLMGDNRQLHQQLNSLKNLPQDKRVHGRHQSAVGRKHATYPKLKQEVWHNLYSCFELDKDVVQRPSGWTTRL